MYTVMMIEKKYPILSTGFGMLVFFTNRSLLSDLKFHRNRCFRVVLDGKSSQEYLVNAGVLQGSILGPTLFLLWMMILSVILLSMPMIVLSTLYVIRHLICSNNYNWFLSLYLIYVTLWTGAGGGLLIFCWKD